MLEGNCFELGQDPIRARTWATMELNAWRSMAWTRLNSHQITARTLYLDRSSRSNDVTITRLYTMLGHVSHFLPYYLPHSLDHSNGE